MISKLINPFKYIAGGLSLFAGLAVLIATALLGYLSHTHFPDLISVKVGVSFPAWYYLIQSLINWLVFSLLLWLCAIIASKSSVRAIDIFGTQALARSPYLLASLTGFSKAPELYGKYVLWKNLQIGEPVEITTMASITSVLFIIITIILTIWMVTLMYNAFRVSSNLKGMKLNLIFIVVFVVSAITTGYISNQLINIFSSH